MYTITKINASRLLVLLSITFGCVTCDPSEVVPNVESFKIYNLPIKAVTPTSDGFAFLSDTVWFLTDKSGNPSQIFQISDYIKYGDYFTSDIIYLNNSIYILASIYSSKGVFIDLGIIQYSVKGEEIRAKKINIIKNFKAQDLDKVNAGYNQPLPVYAKGIILNSAELVIAFNYIEKLEVNWKYALLHLNKDLDLINRKDYLYPDYNSWIYNLKHIGNENFMMTRGGNHYYAIDQFDLSLNIKSHTKNFSVNEGPVTPILTNIIKVNEQQFILTGHADRRNNPDNSLTNNYDFWIIFYDGKDKLRERFIRGGAELIDTLIVKEDLCFTSYLTNDKKIILGGVRKNVNQMALENSAQVRVVIADLNGEVQFDYSLAELSGMSALLIHENTISNSKTIIGHKLGFDQGNTQTFFKTVKNYKDE
jgi:hypothetical protein